MPPHSTNELLPPLPYEFADGERPPSAEYTAITVRSHMPGIALMLSINRASGMADCAAIVDHDDQATAGTASTNDVDEHSPPQAVR